MYCPSRERQRREKKRQWRNLTAGKERRGGGTVGLCPLPSLAFSSTSSVSCQSFTLFSFLIHFIFIITSCRSFFFWSIKVQLLSSYLLYIPLFYFFISLLPLSCTSSSLINFLFSSIFFLWKRKFSLSFLFHSSFFFPPSPSPSVCFSSLSLTCSLGRQWRVCYYFCFLSPDLEKCEMCVMTLFQTFVLQTVCGICFYIPIVSLIFLSYTSICSDSYMRSSFISVYIPWPQVWQLHVHTLSQPKSNMEEHSRNFSEDSCCTL